MNDYSTTFQKPISQSITAVSQTMDLSSPNSGTSIIQLTGTWVGTLVVEGSNDGTNYVSVDATNKNTRISSLSITGNGVYSCDTNGFQFIRLRSSAWTSGTAVVTAYGSDLPSVVDNISVVRTSSGNLTAVSQTVETSTAGASSITLHTTGTFVGTILFESSSDGGNNWVTVYGFNYTTLAISTTISLTDRIYSLPALGTHFRARMTAYTSGTMVVNLVASTADFSLSFAAQAGSWNVQGTAPEGNSIVGVYPLIIGGSYETSDPNFTTDLTAAHLHLNKRGHLKVEDIPNTSGVQGAVSVTTSATAIKVGASNLINRKSVTAHNNGTSTTYWGYSNAVTTSSGTPLAKGQFTSWAIGPDITIYMITASGTQDVRVTESA